MHSKELENIFEYGSTLNNYNDPILVPVTELRTTSLPSTQTFLPSISTTLLDKSSVPIQTTEVITYTTVPTTTATKITYPTAGSYGSSSNKQSVMRSSIPKKQIDYDQSSFVNSEAVSSESVSSSSSEPKKKIPSRTVNMVELSYGDFQVLQFPYVDLTWDEAKNFCDNIGIEFHQNLAY